MVKTCQMDFAVARQKYTADAFCRMIIDSFQTAKSICIVDDDYDAYVTKSKAYAVAAHHLHLLKKKESIDFAEADTCRSWWRLAKDPIFQPLRHYKMHEIIRHLT
jgi:hypothetical protein